MQKDSKYLLNIDEDQLIKSVNATDTPKVSQPQKPTVKSVEVIKLSPSEIETYRHPRQRNQISNVVTIADNIDDDDIFNDAASCDIHQPPTQTLVPHPSQANIEVITISDDSEPWNIGVEYGESFQEGQIIDESFFEESSNHDDYINSLEPEHSNILFKILANPSQEVEIQPEQPDENNDLGW